MGKPAAKKRQQPKRESTVINSKIQKKQNGKPRGEQQQLKQRLIQEAGTSKLKKTALTKLVKRDGKLAPELPKPGRYVLAPPRTPSEPSGDSDSEQDDYMDRFFGDVEIGGDDSAAESSSDESEPSEEDEADEEEEEDEEDEEEEEEEEEDYDIDPAINPLMMIQDHNFEMDTDDEDDYSDDTFDCQFSPSEFMFADGDEVYFSSESSDEDIDIGDYPESSSSCCSSSSYRDSENEEFVEGNCRFLEVDGSNINFPSNGASIVELENDSDECPQLVPIPKSFLNAPKTKSSTSKKAAPPIDPSPAQDAPEPADLTCYLSHDYSEVLVHLKEPFYFHGLLSIRVLAGCIEILHHTRRATDSTEEILVMATVDDYPVRVSTIPQPSSALTRGLADPAMKRFNYSDLMEVKQSFADHHAVLLLRAVDKNHIKFMQGHMTKKLLPEDFHKTFECALKCKFYKSHPKQFSPIDKDLLELQPSSGFPRIITAGGKNTGKSTFNKCLVNSLLSGSDAQVLYVDLDIGQPEFGAPQTISAYLLDSPVVGKGFLKCHETDPYFSLVYGHCNVALDAIRYAKCVKALFDHLNGQSDLTPIPWVVNTMGYVRGIGLDLMHFIMNQLGPTKVLQFKHSQHFLENFPVKLDSEFMRRHESTVLESPSYRDWEIEWQSVPGYASNRAEDVRQLKGSEARQMNVLSHLGLAMNRDFATSLNEVEAIW